MENKGILAQIKNNKERIYTNSKSLISIEDIRKLKKDLNDCINPYAANKMIIGAKASLEKIKEENGLKGNILPLDEDWNTI